MDIGISPELARALLLTNGWGRKESIEAMARDPEYVKNKFKFDPEEAKAAVIANSKVAGFDCGVCYCECEAKDQIQINECSHRACSECFADYCKAKLAGGSNSVYSFCVECKFIIPEEIFQKTLTAEEYKKYQQYLRKSYIDMNQQTKWCPGKDCNLACENPTGDAIEI